MKATAAALCLTAVTVLGTPAAAQDAGSPVPSLRLGTGVELELLARLHVDGRFPPPDVLREDEEDERGFDVPRKRVGVRGRVGRSVAFEVETEVERRRPWRDAYVEYRELRAVRIRAGRFKLPFSLDHTTSSANLDFIDRSLAARLAPGRDQGVMAHGRIWGDRLKYEVGAFGSGSTTAARLTGRPLTAASSPIGPVAAAVAVTRGRVNERLVEAVWVNGMRRRTGVELRWQPGPLTVTTEYIRTAAERRGQGIAGDDLTPLVMTGWYVSGTWRLRPRLAGRRIRVDLGGRLDDLRSGSTHAGIGESVSPRAEVVGLRQERAVTLGVTWYATEHLKVQFNGVRETATPHRADGPRWVPVTRLQISL